jgi:hypothetical protein
MGAGLAAPPADPDGASSSQLAHYSPLICPCLMLARKLRLRQANGQHHGGVSRDCLPWQACAKVAL